MVPRRLLSALLVAALLLPVAISVVLGTGRLLATMEDPSGAAVLDRVALALAIVWAVNLIAILLALGANSLGGPPEPPEADES